MQYCLLKEGFGHSNLLDLPLDISSIGELNILDIATGTGAWILDVTCIPEISTHLAATAANRVTLSACNISNAKFPPKPVRDCLAIRFFLQDVMQPFPLEMYGQFDLVHVSLLCLALMEQGWHSVSRVHPLNLSQRT
jgi:SAM-dependent methyltransferase